MGEVYRARDTRLDREVAIKVLPDEVAADPRALSRFEHEARAVAALTHPNILALFDVGESGGVHYAVSELLQGQTLRLALAEGPIPVRRALDVALKISEALAAAHENGIVHRDVKPENVFLAPDGRVKLLDFGLAKRDGSRHDPNDTRSPTVTALSEPGGVVGTVAYMSPEQAKGHPVDFRSDQFSLGIVLYEMLAGARPFKGASAAEILAAVIRDEPESLEKVAPGTPAPVRLLIERLLTKEPDGRYDSTRDLVRELTTWKLHPSGASVSAPTLKQPRRKAWLAFAAATALFVALFGVWRLASRAGPRPGPAAAKQPLRIVVFPFENLGSPDDAYFASGMAEEITSRLANVRTLAVISRTTATQYDRKGKTVEQIGKDLGVSHVLEGSVRWDKSGGGPGRVRITPQLIRVADDTHLWTDRYDRQLADIFAVQGDVADGVVRALNLTLAPRESAAARNVPTHDLDAYDLYLRALDLERQRQQRSVIAERIRLAGAAVERDPNFAEATALLSGARLMNYWLYYDRRESELERARVEAERSVALRPDSAETHTALGYYYYYGRLDYDAAVAEFEKALAIRPNDASAHAPIGLIRRRQGRMAEAESELRQALEGDPRNGTLSFNLGETQTLSRKYVEAVQTFQKSVSLNPRYASGYYYLAWAYVQWKGDVTAARHVLESASKAPGVEDPYNGIAFYLFQTALMSRDWTEASRQLEASTSGAVSSQSRYIPASLLRGQLFSCMGRRDSAASQYEEARRHLETKIREAPEDARLRSSFGIALAGLGRMTEAVREGKRSVELMSPERDAFRGTHHAEDLALIYTMVGNQEDAIQQLDYLLSHPSWISVPLLRLDPRWDPLRKNPKFEALLAKYEGKP